METNYKIGRVYKIINRLTTDIYIGSTFSTLNERWREHKNKFNYWLNNKTKNKCSIFDNFKKYGIHNHKIILIKEYLCYKEDIKDYKHLRSKEQLWINKMNCINKYSSFNPLQKERIKQTAKKWRDVNINRIKDKAKEWYEKNKDYDKKYYQKNKNKKKQQNKEWRELNNIKTTCICGSKYIKRRAKEHEKTKKHQNFINIQK